MWWVFGVFGFLFLLISYILPNHYPPFLTFYQDFLVFLGLVFLGWGCLRKQVRLDWGAFGVFLCSLIPFLQWVLGVVYFSGDALLASLYLLGFSAAIILGRTLVDGSSYKTSGFTVLAAVFMCAAVLSVWIALRQWLLLSGSIWVADLRPGGRPFANLAQPNSLATLLCMGVAAVLYLFEKHTLGRVVAILLALFLIFGIALTQSRTPWVGALCALLWWAWKSHSVSMRLSVGGFSIWIGIYALVVLAIPSLAEVLGLAVTSLAERAQAMQRLGLWWQLWQAVVEGPLWGYGWNQISVAQVGVSLDHPLPLMTEHSHNILLDLLLWNGPVLGGLIILLISVWLVRLVRRARTTESVFALLAVGFVLVHGMLEYPLDYAFFLLPVGLLLGMIAADQQAPATFCIPRWVHLGFVLVATGVLGWVWYEYRIVDEDFRLMRYETARIGNLKAEHKAPDVVLLTQSREFIRFARTEVRENMSSGELKWMRKVARRYPYPPSLLRYAVALGLNQQPEAAYEQMLILRGLHGDKWFEEGLQALMVEQERYPQLVELVEQLGKVNL